MNENKYSYPAQFALLLGAFGVGLMFAGLVGSAIGAILLHVPIAKAVETSNLPGNVNASRIINSVASFLAFMAPPLVFAKLISRRPFKQLGFSPKMNTQQVLLILVIAFSGLVLGGALSELNEKIPLPAALMTRARASENTYQQATMGMLQMKNFAGYLVSLLVLAVLPAIFEETLFRGGFQQIFIGWTKNVWLGIIITSVLFSAIHFSYFGFLSRATLGIILGLVFYYSKNIWLSILIHFLNNALIVTQLYVMSLRGQKPEKTMDESMPLWWGALALMVLLVFMRMFRRQSDELLLEKPSRVLNITPDDPFS